MLRVTLFGDNLTDEERFLFEFGTDFGVSGKLASPPTYGVRVADPAPASGRRARC